MVVLNLQIIAHELSVTDFCSVHMRMYVDHNNNDNDDDNDNNDNNNKQRYS